MFVIDIIIGVIGDCFIVWYCYGCSWFDYVCGVDDFVFGMADCG